MNKAPWTDEQVKNLNEYQNREDFHPFTCPNRDDSRHLNGHLIATNDGWRCPWCDYTQDWTHESMLQPPPPPFDFWSKKEET